MTGAITSDLTYRDDGAPWITDDNSDLLSKIEARGATVWQARTDKATLTGGDVITTLPSVGTTPVMNQINAARRPTLQSVGVPNERWLFTLAQGDGLTTPYQPNLNQLHSMVAVFTMDDVAAASQVVFGSHESGSLRDILWVLGGSTTLLRYTVGTSGNATILMSKGIRHCAVTTFDPSDLSVRIACDGILGTSGVGVLNTNSSSPVLIIGAQTTNGASPLSGTVDEVQIWPGIGLLATGGAADYALVKDYISGTYGLKA